MIVTVPPHKHVSTLNAKILAKMLAELKLSANQSTMVSYNLQLSDYIIKMRLLSVLYYKYWSYNVSEHHNFKPVLIIETNLCTDFYYKYWF